MFDQVTILKGEIRRLSLLGLKGLKARLRSNFSRNLKGNVDESIARKVACYKQQRILQTDFAKIRRPVYFTYNSQRNFSLRDETRKEDVTPAVSSATCLATALRDKLQEKLHRVIAPVEQSRGQITAW